MAARKGIRKEAILPLMLVSSAVGLGLYTGYRILLYSPEVHLSNIDRKLPLRDTHEKSAQYVSHRKSIGSYDKYVEKPIEMKSLGSPQATETGTPKT